ncbi:2,5-diketo-D-gluconic acid reductase [Campylobacter sp. MIT 12-5580]|uniref:aldo/keto reductase n=1 Tax=Campylobacter sp. MIT 12-5580 TaxID=2040651 RepID=UPI0010F4AFBE|nr:aldo/keto reductase [Campylobacter sp. MIT 12-5580]TKX29602.1 2,5-diketo-D-gluconic acid reductase [Campylobacter sp. MIT 12-5580]
MNFITLNNGVKMPMLGYGTYNLDAKTTRRCVEDALSVGYRSIDTAEFYKNEEAIGEAIIASGIKREELFITSKIWVSNMNENVALKAFEASLKRLRLDYLDLYLIHWPVGDIYGAWRAMSKLYKEGKIKAIGVSNFLPDRIVDFCINNEIKPAINQVECNPLYQRANLQKVMQEYNVAMQSWASFGQGRSGVLDNNELAKIAKKHNKSIAQVVLNWLIERDIVVIPKSTKKERMIENLNVFDFSLDESDKAQIAKLEKGVSGLGNQQDPQRVKRLIELR